MPRAKTSAEQREMEAQECWGGLRNPNRSSARNPALRKVGLRLRQVLDSFVDLNPKIADMGLQLGTGEDTDFSETELKNVRADLARAFGIEAPGHLPGH